MRLTYTKLDNAKFHGHLELSSILFRAARRAGVQVVFSRGFNPRPKFAFGPPLQLGIESECELVDVLLQRKTDPDKLLLELNAVLPKGIQLRKVEEIPFKSAPIQAANETQLYQARWISEGVFSDDIYDGWNDKELVRERKGKTKTVPLNRYVSTLSGDTHEIRLKSHLRRMEVG